MDDIKIEFTEQNWAFKNDKKRKNVFATLTLI